MPSPHSEAQRYHRGLTLGLLRRIVAVVCAACVAGMIVTNIRDQIAGAMAFGLVAATAMLVLIVATSLDRPANLGGAQAALAAELEARVGELVSAGADEAAVRDVVRKAHRLDQGD